MKKIILLLIAIISLVGCKDSYVEEPKKLIDRDEMIDIIYDLAVLDAIKSQNLGAPTNYPTSTEFLKKRYNVDSLTFAQNTKYYASDIEKYKKMYEEVKDRLKKKLDSENSVGKITPPADEQGIVK